jgi:hypothetical protein
MSQDKRHPKSTFDAKYPYNRVYISESGHEIHYDDTPKKERIRRSHKSGTYEEIGPDGKQVNMVVGSKFEYIKQGLTQTVDKNVDIKIGGASRSSVTGSSHSEVKGDSTSAVDGDVRTMIGGDSVSAVKGDAVHGVTGKMTLKVGGGLQLKGDGAKDMKIDGKANLQFGDTLLISGQADITIESATRLIFQVGDNQIIITNDHISVIAKNGNLYSYAEKTIHDFAVETAKVQPPWEPGAEKPPEA